MRRCKSLNRENGAQSRLAAWAPTLGYADYRLMFAPSSAMQRRDHRVQMHMRGSDTTKEDQKTGDVKEERANAPNKA